MKRILTILLLLLGFLATQSLAQTVAKYQSLASRGNVQSQTGGVNSSNKLVGSYPGCTITVYLTGTTTVAQLYTNVSLTAKSNPFTADSEGYYEFYIAPGTYDIRFSGTGITTPFTRSGVVISLSNSDGVTINTANYGTAGDAYSEILERSITATNGSPTITSNARFPARWVGLTNISVNITHNTSYQAYTISSCASTSSCTLSSNFSGTTTTSARLLAYIRGTATGSSTTFTCAYCNFSSSRDTGKKIVLSGIGSAAAHVTTIASVTNSTTVVLTLAPPTSGTVDVTFGTDNTTAFANALSAADAAGGARVNIPTGKYLLNYLSLPKQTILAGMGREATQLLSYASSGGVVRSIWPSNSNTKVHSAVEHLGIRALDLNSFQSGFHDNGGSFVRIYDLYIQNTHWGAILDQTELGEVELCNFETYNLLGYGGYRSTYDPTTSSYFTKTGSQSTTTDGTYWRINTATTNATTYYTKSLVTTFMQKGATFIFRGVSVASSDGTSLPNSSVQSVIDDGTHQYILQFTGTQVRLNNGTLRNINVGSYGRLNIAVGGATADLYIDGVLVDTGIPYVASSGSARIGWGDFATTDDADAYWSDMQWYASNPLPASVWIVNGAEVTPGNSGGYTNRISLDKNQFNVAAVQVADDGGYTHTFRANNWNGGIYQLRLADVIGADVSAGEHEGNVLSAILFAQTTLQGSVGITGNNGISILNGNTITSWGAAPGFPQIRLEEGTGITINGNYFGTGNAYSIDIIDKNAVQDINAHGNGYTTTNLLNAIPPYGTAVFMSKGTSAKEAWQNRVATYRFAVDQYSPATIGSNQNDYDPAGEGGVLARSAFRISSDASRNITGIIAGREGQIIYLTNVGSNDIVFKHQDTGSTAANRLISSYGLDITLSAGLTAMATYDSTSARWRIRLVD